MKRFYFTYGCDEDLPFQKGWTEVLAPSRQTAVAAFRAFHPDKCGGVLNCADVYSEEQFKRTEMSGPGGNFGVFCHEVITISRELKAEVTHGE